MIGVNEFLLCAAPEVKEYITKLQPLGDRVPLEDNNKAAVVMDFDGNGWSDRLTMMVHFPTVIFKQVRAWCACMLTEGSCVHQAADLMSLCC